MKKKGFTLIELLVVIAIIGLLSTLAVVALNSARLKARDAKRIADVKQMQTALELYFNDQSRYPGGYDATGTTYAAATAVLGTGGNYVCLGTIGWGPSACAGAYMGLVPSNPSPGGTAYNYISTASGSYSITFNLEGQTGGLPAGAHTASPDGIN